MYKRQKYLGEIGTAGFEMPEQLAFFPFALTNEWGESYPAIFMLSCLAALIVAIVGLTRKPGGRDGQLFPRTGLHVRTSCHAAVSYTHLQHLD